MLILNFSDVLKGAGVAESGQAYFLELRRNFPSSTFPTSDVLYSWSERNDSKSHVIFCNIFRWLYSPQQYGIWQFHWLNSSQCGKHKALQCHLSHSIIFKLLFRNPGHRESRTLKMNYLLTHAVKPLKICDDYFH